MDFPIRIRIIVGLSQNLVIMKAVLAIVLILMDLLLFQYMVDGVITQKFVLLQMVMVEL